MQTELHDNGDKIRR